MTSKRAPMATGTLLALAAALLFGVTTPAVKLFGRGVGAFGVASLLYTGAALFAVATRGRVGREAPLRRGDLGRVVVVAVLGAAIAPALLAFGLSRASSAAAALLTGLEAVFTLALGAAVHREHVGRRVVVAALAMTAGGVVLVASRGATAGRSELVGLVAVAGATLAWALDNTLSRPLADRDPGAVVRAKATIGAALSLAVALALGEPRPSSLAAFAGLLACGALGYGLSLRLYLLAQRAVGAGRTASAFAAAPFFGAAAAWAIGEPIGGVLGVVAALAMLLGAFLHATEGHDHPHAHGAIEHEHAHRHDDGHHDHAHDPMPEGEHSHVHRHEPLVHAHPHGPDLHHSHEHDAG